MCTHTIIYDHVYLWFSVPSSYSSFLKANGKSTFVTSVDLKLELYVNGGHGQSKMKTKPNNNKTKVRPYLLSSLSSLRFSLRHIVPSQSHRGLLVGLAAFNCIDQRLFKFDSCHLIQFH